MHQQPTTHSPHVRSSPSVSISSTLSTVSSNILPHAALSSQSDVTSSDLISQDSLSSRLQPLRRPSHDNQMGQSYSSEPPSPQSLSKSSALGQAAVVTGSKLKRAFAARRKKSEDVSAHPFFANPLKRSESRSPSPAPSPSSSSSLTSPSRSALAKLQLASNVFSRKPPKPSLISPPIPPPKQAFLPGAANKPLPLLTSSQDNPRNSIMPVSPGMTSALQFMRLSEEQERGSPAPLPRRPVAEPEPISPAQKEIWRKSDSTMSYHTIRSGTTVGNRTPRPVSMAESLQSNHTIVPVNKRISALISDTEFITLEEPDMMEDEKPSPTTTRRVSSHSSLKNKNRRSASFTFGARLSTSKSHTQSPVSNDLKRTTSEIPHNSPTTLTRAAANGIIAPSNSGTQSTGNNIRGRLAAWTSTAGPTPRSPSQTRRPLPQPPQAPSNRQDAHYPTLRQTAISITSSFSPAAGLAKRAAEKIGRAWGGMHSSNHSGYASSTSSTAPSSYLGGELGRTSSRQSSRSPTPSKNKRRTPNAPSGAWSISSSATSVSTSDSDLFSTPSGPHLGTRLRGSSDKSGIVFGQHLQYSVREAALATRGPEHPVPAFVADRKELQVFEGRRLPALVIRCAQHLMVWGVQEEGLFRLNGRPTHIARLRSEFDAGADFELVECNLGDLDPHAVASVFKAFLRELPEPILTKALGPHFEAAILAEQNDIAETDKQHAPAQNDFGHTRGPTLPSNPRNGNLPLRKPPSLSTLALPKLTAMRPASSKLIYALASLIDRLPEENRDLLLTVTELIKATARESKETRMPLSNLLLVFCPSLSMNPPLLRVLCEEQGIWGGAQAPIFDIKRDSTVLDIVAAASGEDEEEASTGDEQSVQLPGLIADSTSSKSSLVSNTPTSPDNVTDRQHIPFSRDEAHTFPSSEPFVKVKEAPFPMESVEETPESPVLVDSSQIPPSSPPHRRRPKLEGLVQFPTFGSGPPTPLSTRKSIQSLSLPSFGLKAQDSAESSPASSLREKKRDRPSLQRLLTKRSSLALISGTFPSISAPILHTPRVENDSPASTPISAQSYTLPCIEHTTWNLDMDGQPTRPSIERQDSSPPRSDTPIADLYRTPAGSQVSLNTVSSPGGMERTDSSQSDATFCSLPSSSHLDLLETEDEEDWTRSVLLAADFQLVGRHC